MPRASRGPLRAIHDRDEPGRRSSHFRYAPKATQSQSLGACREGVMAVVAASACSVPL